MKKKLNYTIGLTLAVLGFILAGEVICQSLADNQIKNHIIPLAVSILLLSMGDILTND